MNQQQRNNNKNKKASPRWVLWNNVLSWLRGIVSWLCEWISNKFCHQHGPRIDFQDGGRSVRLGRQIAEGGFSFVFEAHDDDCKNNKRRYAVKRIHCSDDEVLESARREASIHRAVGRHDNCLELLGVTIQQQQENNHSNNRVCFMLFPYLPHSLRQELNRTILRNDNDNSNHGRRRPAFTQIQALQIVLGIARGVQALHDLNYSHRDVKPDNVLLDAHHHPILMDFGSVGPRVHLLDTRRDVLEATEHASQHTTLPYRPPELLESCGTLHAGDAPLDYTKVDVWSLACTLYALFYGASPFEVEFHNNNSGNTSIRIVECSPLRILGKIPKPPQDSELASWCRDEIFQLMEWMLTHDQMQRPTLHDVMERVQELIVQLGGTVPSQQQQQHDQQQQQHGDDNHDDSDLDDLLGNNNHV